ncbi:MAG: hypothetical protein ACFCUM_04560 [Bacteroidales bacterium]
MKSLIYLLTFLLILIGCSKDGDLLNSTVSDKPSAMNVFCQKTPNDTIRRITYEYDNDNLMTESNFYNGDIQERTTYEYNTDNQLILETYETFLRKTVKSYIYNELSQLINIIYLSIDYDSNGQTEAINESEAPREYENNQLVKEWHSWGGFNTYEYSNGNVVNKVEYTRNGDRHHITTYKYLKDFLIEEKKETRLGSLIFLKTYTYDSKNRLIQIRDKENNLIEERHYINNNLIEKRTYYFGIDPGFDRCYGNYIYRYEY